MAGSLNKVLLIGRLGADPEIKQMVNGKSVARLSLATSQSWKDKNTGEKKEKTEWHRIVVFNEGLVNVIQQYLKKGAQIYVEGQLTTRKWKDEQSGQDKYSIHDGSFFRLLCRALPAGEHLTRIENTVGIEDGLDSAHSVNF